MFSKLLKRKEFLDRPIMGRNIDAIAILKKWKISTLKFGEKLTNITKTQFLNALKKIKELIAKGKIEDENGQQLLANELNIIFQSPEVTKASPSNMALLAKAVNDIGYYTDWEDIRSLKQIDDQNPRRGTLDEYFYLTQQEVRRNVGLIVPYLLATFRGFNNLDPADKQGSLSPFKPLWVSTGGDPKASILQRLFTMDVGERFYPMGKLLLSQGYYYDDDEDKIYRRLDPEEEDIPGFSTDDDLEFRHFQRFYRRSHLAGRKWREHQRALEEEGETEEEEGETESEEESDE